MLNNIPIKTTNGLKAMIDQAMTVMGLGYDGSFAGMPIVAYGDAGCGKSYAPMSVAKERGIVFAHMPIESYGVSDVTGPRTIDFDTSAKRIKHWLPDWTKELDPNEPAIIEVSEVTKGLPAVIKQTLGILNEGRSGNFERGKRWQFVLTGNVSTAKGGDVDLNGPLRNRVAQVLVKNTCHNWLVDFAIPHNVHYLVQTFVERNSEGSADFPNGCLNTWDPADNPAAWASERSWTNMSKILVSGLDARDWASTVLGNHVGEYFATHCMIAEQLASNEQILESPESAPVPDDTIVQHYAGVQVAYIARPEVMAAICTYLRRFPLETAVTAMQDITKRHPSCKETAAYVQFRQEYKLTV
jgi:hypothetical protein